MPLPSKTQGPASFRGVMGPSCVTWPPPWRPCAPAGSFGDGVRVGRVLVVVELVAVTAVWTRLIPMSGSVCAPGMGTGSVRECVGMGGRSSAGGGRRDSCDRLVSWDLLVSCDRLASSDRLVSFDRRASWDRRGSWTRRGGGGAMSMVTSIGSGSSTSGREESTPPPSTVWPLIMGWSEAPFCCFSPPCSSSDAKCSHSSGSSTSASRSATARQFGHMNIGYCGEASSIRMHL